MRTDTAPAHRLLPDTGFLRQTDLVGRPAISSEKAAANRARGKGIKRPREALRGLFPFTDGTLWRKVKRGEFPAPVKLGTRITAWRVEDVRAWIQARGE